MRKIIILLILITFLVVGTSTHSYSTIKKSGQQNNNQPTESSNIQPDKSNDTGKAIIAPNRQDIPNVHNQEPESPENQEQQWYSKIRDNPTDWLLALFSGLLVYFTYRLSKTTNRLWKVSQGQHETMDRQVEEMQKSVIATQEAAIAAKTSADALSIIERAYLFEIITTDILKLEIEESLDHICVFKILIHNDGKTPAVLNKVFAFAGLKDVTPSDLIGVEEIEITSNPQIRAGGVYEIIVPFSIRKDVWNMVRAGTRQLYCYGRIDYEDIFKLPQFIFFCWHYDHHRAKCIKIRTKLNYST